MLHNLLLFTSSLLFRPFPLFLILPSHWNWFRQTVPFGVTLFFRTYSTPALITPPNTPPSSYRRTRLLSCSRFWDVLHASNFPQSQLQIIPLYSSKYRFWSTNSCCSCPSVHRTDRGDVLRIFDWFGRGVRVVLTSYCTSSLRRYVSRGATEVVRCDTYCSRPVRVSRPHTDLVLLWPRYFPEPF